VNPDEASSYCCRTALLLPDEGGEAGMLGRRTRPRPLAGRVGGGGAGDGEGRRAAGSAARAPPLPVAQASPSVTGWEGKRADAVVGAVPGKWRRENGE
jgi:hypothetical protein